MRHPIAIRLVIASGLLATAFAATARAQADAADAAPLPPLTETPRLTVRLHTGPSLNMMSDWRDGMDALAKMASSRGLSPEKHACLCMSWGTTAVVHVADRVAVGGIFEMLRDTRAFTVNDEIRGFSLVGSSGMFSFNNEAVIQTQQIVVDVYPRDGSRLHLQFGGGTANGHASMHTPGSTADSRVRGTMGSISVGTETRFWYVDAGWRFLPMHTTARSVDDFPIDEARDVFATVGDVQAFVQDRKIDLSGGWARIGLAFHFGHR